MTQYILAIPQVDSSLPWHKVKVFDSKREAVKYSDDNLGTDNGWYCMLSYDGEYYIADTIHPNLTPGHNPHLAIDVFRQRADCVKYIQANYNSDSEGIINLIFEA